MLLDSKYIFFFFFNDTATTEIYTLSLHDALPISSVDEYAATLARWFGVGNSDLNTIFPNLSRFAHPDLGFMKDRKSTRLNSSHANISYAVFCLKKKKQVEQVSLIIVMLGLRGQLW